MSIPSHMQESIDTWVQYGAPHPSEMGSFLRAVLTNDLKGAVMHADDRNRAAIVAWVVYLYNEVPGSAHGSLEKLLDWHERGGLQVKRASGEAA